LLLKHFANRVFFCKGEKDGRIGKKEQEKRQRDESEEKQTGTESADAAGERRTARYAGDERVEEGASKGDLSRDRSGSG
jgi:hypothetical protein